MHSLKVSNLLVSEAEEVIAKVWIAVERHGCPSPKMTIFSTATKLEIEFLFDSPRDERLVGAELPRRTIRKINGQLNHGSLSRPVVARHRREAEHAFTADHVCFDRRTLLH